MAFVGTYCSDSDTEGFKNIQIPAEELSASIAADELNHTIHFNATQSWEASVQEVSRADSWITIYPTSGEAGENQIEVTLTENTGNQSREATITITCGGERITITITQRAIGEPGPDEPQRPEFPEIPHKNRPTYIEISEYESYNQGKDEYSNNYYAELNYYDHTQLGSLSYYQYDQGNKDRISASYETGEELDLITKEIAMTQHYIEIKKNRYGILTCSEGDSLWFYQLSAGGLIKRTTNRDGVIFQRFTYNADGTLASSTFTNPYDPEDNYQTKMTWQDGNLTSIQTTGNNKDQGTVTYTYTEHLNPWVGVDIGAIVLTGLEEFYTIIGSCGITTKNLPATSTDNEGITTTYEYTFDGEGRVSTIIATSSNGGDRYERTYILHYGEPAPYRPAYISYLTKQEVVESGALYYTFNPETPDEHFYSVNQYTSYAIIRSYFSDEPSKNKTEYRTISILAEPEGGSQLEPIYLSQEDVDNFGIVSTSLQEIELGEGVTNPHRFVYTIQYNCFSVELVAEVFYPSCTFFNTGTGLFEEYMMLMLPMTEECFILEKPQLNKLETGDPNMDEYYYTQDYLFQINEMAEPSEHDYQRVERHIYVTKE